MVPRQHTRGEFGRACTRGLAAMQPSRPTAHPGPTLPNVQRTPGAHPFRPVHYLPVRSGNRPKYLPVFSQPLVCGPRHEWPVRRFASTMSSQCGQDAFLDATYFHAARDGVYLDFGCNDGRSNSNTYHFNKGLGWYGKCYEADPTKFRQIADRAHRSDGVHAAISRFEGTAQFSVVNVPDGGLSGLATTLDVARARSHGPIRTVSVPTVTPRSVLDRYYMANRTLDYVSIDVEGHELEVMRAWPFNSKWCVSVFTIENNHWCNKSRGVLNELKALMPAYEHVNSIGPDELFVRRTPCPENHIRRTVRASNQPDLSGLAIAGTRPATRTTSRPSRLLARSAQKPGSVQRYWSYKAPNTHQP